MCCAQLPGIAHRHEHTSGDAGDDDCFVGEDEVLEEGREVAADAIKDRADVSPTLSGNGDHFFSGFQLFRKSLELSLIHI